MTTNIPMQTAPVAGQVVVYQANTGYPPSSLNRQAALITGSIQIVLAFISLCFGVACIFSGDAQAQYIAVPIWGALVFYIVAGILGVIAGQSKGRNTSAIVGCMVMSIFAAVTAFFHVGIGSGSTIENSYWEKQKQWYFVNLLTTLIGVIEFVVAIVASVFMCCGATCCCGQQTANANVLGQPQYASYVVQPGEDINQGQVACQGYSMMQQQFVGQPGSMGQPQVMGQPQQIQYTDQAHAQPPAYTEHESGT